MENFAGLPLERLMDPAGFDCACGKHHSASLQYLRVEAGAIAYAAEMVRALECRKPFVVCDEHTWQAAGERVCNLLTEAGIPFVPYLIPSRGAQRIAPSEWEVGSVMMHADPSCDLFLGVGSGVINDICKVLAYGTGRKNAIIGTAPSMDGYASNSSAMEVNNIKMTLFNQPPAGILLDTAILREAPMRMLWAGLGDMVAKHIALCEWRISHLITGEYYCENVAGLMREATRRAVAAAEGLPSRDPEAIQSIAEGLVISGIAMAYAGISRPASGLEHQFSHLWEMMALDRGREYDLHGIQVGVGTMLVMKLYRRLKTITPSREQAEAYWREMTPDRWERMMRDIFGKAAPELIDMEAIWQKNDPAAHTERLDRILAHWEEIQAIIREEMPEEESLRRVLEKTGMPLRPSEIGISLQDTVDAFRGSRDVRNKYQSSSLIWDLGLTDDFAAYLQSVAEE